MCKGLCVFSLGLWVSTCDLSSTTTARGPPPNYALLSEIDNATFSDWQVFIPRIATEPALGIQAAF